MARRLHHLATLLVLALALCVAVYAQGPSDTGNGPPGTPVSPPQGAPGSPTVTTVSPVPTTTAPAGGNVPTTTPPGAAPAPTVTTRAPAAGNGATTPDANGATDANAVGTVPKTTTPAPVPTRTTRAPAAGAVVPAATPATPPPAITTTSPEILVDRQVKSEYGTRTPTANDTSTATSGKSEASKMGSWLVPAVIGAVIISALIIMTFFVRSRRSDGPAADDYATPRRGSDNFHEHPKSTTHQQVNVPVLGDPVKDKVAADQSNMRALQAAHHSPRANRVASSPPLMTDLHRPPSPGFGANKPKPVDGSAVVF